LDETESRLASVMAGLRDNASTYVALSLGANSKRISESNDEHAKLIECCRNKDTKGAITMTIRHLRATLADIEAAHQ
jgi:DNA-binding GntR family transcriptional regulator